MKLKFLGGAGTVTGSRYLLAGSCQNILIDCGLFQGLKTLRLKNWEPFPFPPNEISAIFLTHAHLDHSGYLPRLINEGFRGKIYCTSATFDLCRILLLDSAKIQEEEAKSANKYGYSKHRPARPLYTVGDVMSVLANFKPINFDEPFEANGFHVEFNRAGHILGAASIRFTQAGKSITFSGDVGRMNDSIMHAPDFLKQTDYLVVESTYGNRRHPANSPSEELKSFILETARRAGSIVIPAFTVGRAQQILFEIAKLKAANAIPDLPVYLNSPMATSVTDLYQKHIKDHKLSREMVHLMCDNVHYVQSPEESKALNEMTNPRIIVSASGMAVGGRVLYHLLALGEDPRNLILFAGFQAAGTRGAALVSGSREIKIHGQYMKINARVANLESLSAHADYAEILDWLDQSKISPKKVFVSHGEPEASDSMRHHIEARFPWPCSIPAIGECFDLD